MSAKATQSSSAVTLRLSLGCELTEVRAVRLAVRSFLARQGLSEEQLRACELALVEACNNAIKNVSQAGRHQPIVVGVLCNGMRVELRVDDHTPGFKWPDRVELPRADHECGRGLFFIRVLMDGARYFRRRGENRLIMRKERQGERPPPASAKGNPMVVSPVRRRASKVVPEAFLPERGTARGSIL